MSTTPVLGRDDQRDLRALGVSDRQLIDLEKALAALPRSLVPAPAADVRAELSALAVELRRTLVAVESLSSANSLVQREALERLIEKIPFEIIDSEPPPTTWEQLQDTLPVVILAAEEAFATVPKVRRQVRIDVVGAVDEALQRSARVRAKPNPKRAFGWGSTELPPDYLFQPSRSLTSRFFDVLVICARALTGERPEPERAIRYYLESKARRRRRP